VARFFFIAGGAIFVFLGCVHAIYMLADLRRPRRLVPADPVLIQAMAGSAVRLSTGGTDMWRAWIGFNFSHALGAIVFGSLCIGAGIFIQAMPKGLLLVPAAIGCFYLLLSIRYWFRAATIGIALSTALLLTGWLLA
jgi:hypothetical protein